MNPLYRVGGKVSYSQVSSDGRLALYAAMNCMQDCGAFQMEDLGRGSEYFKNNGQALFITAWQVEMDEMPLMGTEIYTDTWIYGYDAISCYRNYIIRGTDGRVYIRAYAAGAFVDVATGKPTRLTEDIMSHYPMDKKMDMDYLPRKIKLPSSWDAEGHGLKITKRHLDKNSHVNNSRYIAMAEEQLPDDFRAGRMRAEYKKPAAEGDVMVPRLKRSEKSCVVALCPPEGTPYAVTEFFPAVCAGQRAGEGSC